MKRVLGQRGVPIYVVGVALVFGPIIVEIAFRGSVKPEVGAVSFALGTVISWVGLFAWPSDRPRPDGYVGRFRRPDGTEVHVGRVGGNLMVVSDTQPPIDLGNVSGRDLLHWEKLASTPDGHDRIPRAG